MVRRRWLALCLALTAGAALLGLAPVTAAPRPSESPPVDWLSHHWRRPIPPQGPAPGAFSVLEASLAAQACGTCHAAQFGGWQRSFHGRAFSPGLEGQLMTMPRSEQATCLTCHAPLHEQHLFDPRTSRRNEAFDPKLQASGVSCAVCHVRERQRFGPPRGPLSLPAGNVHGGATLRPEYEQSRFCASCHQFDATGAKVNGKYIENTFNEWQASDYAKRGTSCQTCHMPNRDHQWEGIHSPAMVRKGLTLRTLWPTRRQAEIILTNSGVGHAFPTYTTPEVTLRAWAEDAAGKRLPQSWRSYRISRDVDFAPYPPVERWDTRLLPGRSARLNVPVPKEAVTVRAEVFVDPDHFYTGLYHTLLAGTRPPDSQVRLQRALADSRQSPFIALRSQTVVPAKPGG